MRKPLRRLSRPERAVVAAIGEVQGGTPLPSGFLASATNGRAGVLAGALRQRLADPEEAEPVRFGSATPILP